MSLAGNMFFFDFFGSRILLFQLLTLLAIPFYYSTNFKFLNKLIYGIRFEYFILVVLGIIFGFVMPWEDDSLILSWNQLAQGRTIVALTRILIEILLIYYVYSIFKNGKIKLSFFLTVVNSIIIFSSFFAFVDFVFNHSIYKFLFSEYNTILDSRFIGFSHEPRSFGRLLIFPWVLLLIFKINNVSVRYQNPALIVGFIVIIASLSFSTYILLILALIVLGYQRLYFSKFSNILLSFIFVSFFLFISFNIINKLDYFNEGLISRYSMITKGKSDFQMKNEPLIFTSFEVFDRAALNFFYNNLNYIYFGTGPNLISIPASKYLDRSAMLTFEDTLVGIPSIGLFNHVSRAGLFGLLLYVFAFRRINKFIKITNDKKNKELFIVSVFLYLLISNPWIYFVIGFVIAQTQLSIKNNIV